MSRSLPSPHSFSAALSPECACRSTSRRPRLTTGSSPARTTAVSAAGAALAKGTTAAIAASTTYAIEPLLMATPFASTCCQLMGYPPWPALASRLRQLGHGVKLLVCIPIALTASQLSHMLALALGARSQVPWGWQTRIRYALLRSVVALCSSLATAGELPSWHQEPASADAPVRAARVRGTQHTRLLRCLPDRPQALYSVAEGPPASQVG